MKRYVYDANFMRTLGIVKDIGPIGDRTNQPDSFCNMTRHHWGGGGINARYEGLCFELCWYAHNFQIDRIQAGFDYFRAFEPLLGVDVRFQNHLMENDTRSHQLYRDWMV
jgi:hypothetical protein